MSLRDQITSAMAVCFDADRLAESAEYVTVDGESFSLPILVQDVEYDRESGRHVYEDAVSCTIRHDDLLAHGIEAPAMFSEGAEGDRIMRVGPGGGEYFDELEEWRVVHPRIYQPASRTWLVLLVRNTRIVP